MSLKHLFFLTVGFVLFFVSCGQTAVVSTMVAATAVPTTPPPTATVTATQPAPEPTAVSTRTPSPAATETPNPAEQVPSEAILYPDTVITTVENGIAYDQNGVVAARQVEHNGEMVWIPAIVEQMNARGEEVMNLTLSDGSGRTVRAMTHGFENYAFKDGTPVNPQVVFWDQPRAEAAFKIAFDLITTEGIQAQDVSDPNGGRGVKTINPQLMVTDPDTGEQISAIELLKTRGTITVHFVDKDSIPEGIAGTPGKGLAYQYGATADPGYLAFLYNPENSPANIDILFYFDDHHFFPPELPEIFEVTGDSQFQFMIHERIVGAFFALSQSHDQLKNQSSGFTYVLRNPDVEHVFRQLVGDTGWVIDSNKQQPALWIELADTQ